VFITEGAPVFVFGWKGRLTTICWGKHGENLKGHLLPGPS